MLKCKYSLSLKTGSQYIVNKFLTLILMIGFFFIPSVLQSQTLKIAAIDWCPYVCLSNSKYPGVLVECIKEVYKNTEYKIEFEVFPWSRAILLTKAGEVDALLSPAKNEAPSLIFPETAIGTQRFCMFTLKEDLWSYAHPRSVSGRSVIYPKDALPQEVFNIVHKVVPSYGMPYVSDAAFLSKSFELLLMKRYDTILMTYYSTLDYINKNKLSDRIKISGCVSSQKIYIAFSPDPGKQEKIQKLIEIFEKEIVQLKKRDYFQKLLKKYQLTLNE